MQEEWSRLSSAAFEILEQCSLWLSLRMTGVLRRHPRRPGLFPCCPIGMQWEPEMQTTYVTSDLIKC